MPQDTPQDTTQQALHGAMLPIVRQMVQSAAGAMLGAGIINESEATAIAGLILSATTVVWMLVARAKAAKAPARR